MKIIVFAYSQLGHDCLNFLIQNKENVVAVVTHQDSVNETIWFESVQKLAEQFNIPVLTPDSPNTSEIIEKIRLKEPDILFSFYYRHMICQEILDIAKVGCFNMHGSYLPYYRGRAPVNWAILKGEKFTGATLHYMVKAADAGNIVDQERVDITDTDTAGTVTEKVNQAALDVLRRQIENIKAGTNPSISQNHSLASYFGRRTSKDGQINWNQSAWEIHNLIRALQPYPQYPPAFSFWQDKEVVIMKSLPPIKKQDLFEEVGRITNINHDDIEVSCGDGYDRIHITDIFFKDQAEPINNLRKTLKVGEQLTFKEL